MFGVAVWVLRRTLRRYDLADLHAELADSTCISSASPCSSPAQLHGPDRLRVVGAGHDRQAHAVAHLALASFATQSIAHSTGFAFVIGATLRYHFYSDRGLGIGDVAKVQMFFTATFTLGVATLAGAVVLIEPWRLAMATGLPPGCGGLAPATALTLVIAYVVWGGFFHRPLRWRGRELVLPSAGATLIQIFFGVADLIAVAAALYVLLPAELGLGYLEVLAVFMASIVIGLISHVPGSLGVFESAVVLLIQPTEAQTLPLIGSLLAFRAVYYLLPLVCGVVVLDVSEVHRWRGVLALFDRVRLDLGPGAPQVAAMLTFAAGLVLLVLDDAGQPGTGGVVGQNGMRRPAHCVLVLSQAPPGRRRPRPPAARPQPRARAGAGVAVGRRPARRGGGDLPRRRRAAAGQPAAAAAGGAARRLPPCVHAPGPRTGRLAVAGLAAGGAGPGVERLAGRRPGLSPGRTASSSLRLRCCCCRTFSRRPAAPSSPLPPLPPPGSAARGSAAWPACRRGGRRVRRARR